MRYFFVAIFSFCLFANFAHAEKWKCRVIVWGNGNKKEVFYGESKNRFEAKQKPLSHVRALLEIVRNALLTIPPCKKVKKTIL